MIVVNELYKMVMNFQEEDKHGVCTTIIRQIHGFLKEIDGSIFIL